MAEEFGAHVEAGELAHVDGAEKHVVEVPLIAREVDFVVAAAFQIVEGELGHALFGAALQILDRRVLGLYFRVPDSW